MAVPVPVGTKRFHRAVFPRLVMVPEPPALILTHIQRRMALQRLTSLPPPTRIRRLTAIQRPILIPIVTGIRATRRPIRIPPITRIAITLIITAMARVRSVALTGMCPLRIAVTAAPIAPTPTRRIILAILDMDLATSIRPRMVMATAIVLTRTAMGIARTLIPDMEARTVTVPILPTLGTEAMGTAAPITRVTGVPMATAPTRTRGMEATDIARTPLTIARGMAPLDSI